MCGPLEGPRIQVEFVLNGHESTAHPREIVRKLRLKPLFRKQLIESSRTDSIIVGRSDRREKGLYNVCST